jgi:parallel beta-helix repeat protein
LNFNKIKLGGVKIIKKDRTTNETKNSYKLNRIFLFLALILMLSIIVSGTASATNRYVGPGHTYSTIHQAVTASHPGDKIYVYDNQGSSYTYHENNIIVNKNDLTITAVGKVTVQTTGHYPVDQSNFIFALNSQNVTLQNFIIKGNTESYGIFCGNYNIIKNNTIIGNRFGVRAAMDHSHIDVINNTFINNQLYFDSGGYHTIYRNMFINSTINSQSNSHAIISSNTFRNLSNLAMYLDYERYTTVSNNKFNTLNGNNAIELINGYKVLIKNNEITSANIGISLSGVIEDYVVSCNNNTVYSNIIEKSKIALELDNARYNTIKSNTLMLNSGLLRSTSYGILLRGSSSNNITNNIITKHTIGVQISDYVYKLLRISSNSNTIYSNNIFSNRNGIQITSRQPLANRVYYNRIVYNIAYALKNNSSAMVDARYNWWGTNKDPGYMIYNSTTVIYKPWIILTANINPNPVSAGGKTIIKASLNTLVNQITLITKHVPNGIKVSFVTTRGILQPYANTINGIATNTLTTPIRSLISVIVTIVLDNQTIKRTVPIKS